jgi:UDP-2,3-diacylglucosamine pyrophosphatase LpxH
MSDLHHPYIDAQAWNFTLRIVRKLQPEIIWIGGDGVDFYNVSQYSRDPARKETLQDELDIAYQELVRLRKAAPNAQITYQEGNHEFRLQRYLWTRARELASLRSLELPALLRFEDLGIKHVGYNDMRKIGHLYHIHGSEVGGGSANVARGKLLKMYNNVIFGHHHRHEVSTIRNANGTVYAAYANGMLGRFDAEYCMNPQWTQGITQVRYTKSGAFHASPLIYFPNPDNKGKLSCVIDGQLMEG